MPGRTYLRSVFVRNVTSTFVAQLLILALSFGNGAVLARWLGPERRGMLSLALLVPGTLILLVNAGVPVANVYFAGSRRLSVPRLAASSVTFALLGTLAGLGITALLAVTGWLSGLIPGLDWPLLLVAMLMLPLGLLGGSFAAIFQGLQRVITVGWVNLAQVGIGFVLTLFFVVALRWQEAGGLLAAVGGALAGLMLWGVLLRRMGAALRPRWEPAALRSMASYGLRGQAGNILQFLNYRLDMFVVNYFLGATEVGVYNVAVLLAELLWQFPNAVAFVIFPRAAAATPEQLNRSTPGVFRVTLAITALGALLLALVGRPLILTIYSAAFGGAYVPLLLLLPGIVLLGGGKVLTSEIAGRGYAHYNSINAALALVLTILLDLLLIPRFGVAGAAAASSVAYTASFITAVVFYRSVRSRISTEAG